jgi:hypothetical protein
MNNHNWMKKMLVNIKHNIDIRILAQKIQKKIIRFAMVIYAPFASPCEIQN